jgi:uncharacterized membrane protein YvbJ
MVYCAKCGKQNDEGAQFCVDCGATLYPEIARGRRGSRERRKEDECFGLPHGGAIFGLIIGIIIIFVGLQQVFGWNIDLGPLAIIIFGLLIIAGAIYGFTRKPS